MPEGDTIFRAARALHRVLAGKQVTAFETGYALLARVNDDTPLMGRTVERVEARGKWLLMHFSGDLVLVTHMLMNGTWHIYRTGERWQRPRSQMRILLRAGDVEAVAFTVPVAEFHTAKTLARHRMIPQLGADVLSVEYSVQAGAAKLAGYAAAHPDAEVADVLLNQRVLTGIGNVFKSEICFAVGVHPFRTVGTLTKAEMEKIAEVAQRYLAANVKDGSGGMQGGEIVTYTGLRRTTGASNPGDRLWVYGRRGKECRRCGQAILMRKQGAGARLTFWCSQCQPGVDVEGWSGTVRSGKTHC